MKDITLNENHKINKLYILNQKLNAEGLHLFTKKMPKFERI